MYAKLPNNPNSEKENMSKRSKRHRTKSAEDIVNYIADGNNQLKAKIVSKIVDSSDIAKDVIKD